MKAEAIKERAGFTLIELLIVVAIIGLLASISIPAVNTIMENSRRNTARVEMARIATAVERYYADYRRLPRAVPDDGIIRATDFRDASNVIRELQGDNPRGNVYLQPQEGTNGPYYLDPWSRERSTPRSAGNLHYQMHFRKGDSVEVPFRLGNNRTARFYDARVVLFSYGRDVRTPSATEIPDARGGAVFSFDPRDF